MKMDAPNESKFSTDHFFLNRQITLRVVTKSSQFICKKLTVMKYCWIDDEVILAFLFFE